MDSCDQDDLNNNVESSPNLNYPYQLQEVESSQKPSILNQDEQYFQELGSQYCQLYESTRLGFCSASDYVQSLGSDHDYAMHLCSIVPLLTSSSINGIP